MKLLGYLLIIVGFLSGAWVTVLQERLVSWSYFIPAAALGAIGVALVRIDIRRHAQAAGKLASNIQNIKSSLNRVVENVTQLNRDKESIDTYDMRHRIDELLPEDLNIFVEARESIGHVFGLQSYADVMNYFAAGERYINRVWSASADGYIDEVHTYLNEAQEQFTEALHRVETLEQQAM